MLTFLCDHRLYEKQLLSLPDNLLSPAQKEECKKLKHHISQWKYIGKWISQEGENFTNILIEKCRAQWQGLPLPWVENLFCFAISVAQLLVLVAESNFYANQIFGAMQQLHCMNFLVTHTRIMPFLSSCWDLSKMWLLHDVLNKSLWSFESTVMKVKSQVKWSHTGVPFRHTKEKNKKRKTDKELGWAGTVWQLWSLPQNKSMHTAYIIRYQVILWSLILCYVNLSTLGRGPLQSWKKSGRFWMS